MELIHILGKRAEVSGYFLFFFIPSFLFRKLKIKIAVNEVVASLTVVVLQRFLWESWQDLTLIILIIAAVVSLALGIKTEVCE